MYCNICSVAVTASSSGLKQHCVGYTKGKKGETAFVVSEDATKVAKRKERERLGPNQSSKVALSKL